MEYAAYLSQVGLLMFGLLLFAQQAHALECHSCTALISEKDRPVSEPCAAIPSSGGVKTVTCNETLGENACFKLTTFYTPVRNSKKQLVSTVYSRLCGSRDSESCWTQRGGQSHQEYCYCNGDLCNKGHVIKTSLAGFLLCSLIGVFHIVTGIC